MIPLELMRAIRHIEIRSRHLVENSLAGEYQAVFKGRGIEFQEVRPYQPGDDVRTIDWNVTARMGTAFVKEYVEERELTVLLAFDASASGRFGTVDRFKRELGAELAAILAFSAIRNNDKVGLLAFSDRIEMHIPARKGRRHVLRLIRELLALEPQGQATDVVQALDHLNRVLKRRAIIFLISDLMDPGAAQPSGNERRQWFQRALNVTNRRHDLVAITISDPRETVWPDVGLVSLQDAETGAVSGIDTGSEAWRRTFVQRALEQRVARRATLRRAQIDHIEVTLGQDYVTPLLAFFEGRTRRLRR
jgi:uncharacterized protein (DUF58 family)